jgi:hypothetical protein
MPADDSVADRWTREALRVYRRYQLEIVEACGLCPWAERARVDERMRERVLLQQDGADTGASLAAIADWAADGRVEVALLLYPRMTLSRAAFERFASTVRDLDAQRSSLGHIPFALAAFHPDAIADVTHAERLIPFLRRTPDPTLQLVRASVLDRVRDGAPQGTQFIDVRLLEMDAMTGARPMPLRERIARANLASTQKMGMTEFARRLDDIRRDRDEAYRALGA